MTTVEQLTIRRLQPGDTAPVKRLIAHVGVLARQPGLVDGLAKAVHYAAHHPEREEAVQELYRNQNTGLETPVRALHSMRVAEVDGRAVGFSYTGGMVNSWGKIRTIPSAVKAQLCEAVTEIQVLSVHPAARRQGVGAALVADAEQRAALFGSRAVHALVGSGPEDADAAAWWRRRGYTFGPAGIPWHVVPHSAAPDDHVLLDDFDHTRLVGFRAVHPDVTVTAGSLKDPFTGRPRLPRLAGLLG